MDARGEALDVFCSCGGTFCFNCGEEAHRPVDCETVRAQRGLKRACVCACMPSIAGWGALQRTSAPNAPPPPCLPPLSRLAPALRTPTPD